MWRVDCYEFIGKDVSIYNVAHYELVKVLRLLTYIYRVNGGKINADSNKKMHL